MLPDVPAGLNVAGCARRAYISDIGYTMPDVPAGQLDIYIYTYIYLYIYDRMNIYVCIYISMCGALQDENELHVAILHIVH